MGGTPVAIVAEEELARARLYGLLSAWLAAPPSLELLSLTSGLGGEGEVGAALGELAEAAREADPAALEREYFDLFVGLGRGELVPYASYYLTGFVYEKPLADLRADLERLGVRRREGNHEPEDHIASVLEVMAGLVEGRFGDGSLRTQASFFRRHVEPWAGRFFLDLERARAARVYAPLGRLGRLFVELERVAFELADRHEGSGGGRLRIGEAAIGESRP